MTERGIVRLLERDSTTWVAGVAVPLAMVVLDPAVFRSTVFGAGTPILGAFKPFGYVAIGLGMLAVVYQLITRRPSAGMAGVLAAAALFAFVMGLGLLPFSLLGTFFFGLGLLGLTPFVSSAAVAWRASRVYRQATGSHRVALFLVGFGLFLGVCGVVQWQASAALTASIRELGSAPPEFWAPAITRLSRWRILLDLDQMVSAWSHEQDSAAKRRLGDAYRQLTGTDIEERANALVD